MNILNPENEMDEIRRRNAEAESQFDREMREQNQKFYRDFEAGAKDLTNDIMFEQSLINIRRAFAFYNGISQGTVYLSLPNIHAMLSIIHIVNATYQVSGQQTPPIILSIRDFLISMRKKLTADRDEKVKKLEI